MHCLCFALFKKIFTEYKHYKMVQNIMKSYNTVFLDTALQNAKILVCTAIKK